MKAVKRGITVMYASDGVMYASEGVLIEGANADGQVVALFLTKPQLDIINEVWEEGEKQVERL